MGLPPFGEILGVPGGGCQIEEQRCLLKTCHRRWRTPVSVSEDVLVEEMNLNLDLFSLELHFLFIAVV